MAFIMQPEERDDLLNAVSSHLYIARTSIYVVQTFLGDAFIVRISQANKSKMLLMRTSSGLSHLHCHWEEQVYDTIFNCLHFRLNL